MFAEANCDQVLVALGGNLMPPEPRAAGSTIDRYKCSEARFLEEALRKRIRARVIEIGVTRAHALVRKRKRNMAGRRLTSIYSKDGAELAISLRELIATSAALDDDPLEVLFEAIKARMARKAKRGTAA